MSEQQSTAASPTKAAAGKSARGAKKAAAKKGRAGRPSLDKPGKASPQVAFRVATPIRKRAKEVAEKEGLTVSQLGRKALKEYLAKHGEGAGAASTPSA